MAAKADFISQQSLCPFVPLYVNQALILEKTESKDLRRMRCAEFAQSHSFFSC